MRAIIVPFRGQSRGPDKRYWRRRFRPSFEKLRSAQLRDGSLYSNLRTLVPVYVLAIVWLKVAPWDPPYGIHVMLGRSVTVRHLLLAVGVVGLWNLWLSLAVYEDRSPQKDFIAEVYRLTASAFACSLLLLVGNLNRGQYQESVLLAAQTAIGLFTAALSLLGIFAFAAILSLHLLRRRAALIVGTGRHANILRHRLESEYSTFKLYGCVDDDYQGEDATGDAYLGSIDNLAEILKTHPIEVVMIGLPIRSKYDEIQRVVDICETVGVESHYMQDIFDTSRARMQIATPGAHSFAVLSTVNQDVRHYLKRLIDLLGASVLLVLIAPIMVAAAVAVRLSSAGPVFFVQQRYGRNRKRFPMFKFRSMVVDAEAKQAALEITDVQRRQLWPYQPYCTAETALHTSCNCLAN